MDPVDRKSPKNIFQMIQKLFKATFDSTEIIFDHSDHVTAKVDRGEPVQVIRMVMTPPNVVVFTLLWAI